MDELKPCPSCKFGRDAYAQHLEVMRGNCGSWETYCPELINVFGIWFVNCQNCGFMATWCGNMQDDRVFTIEQWNKLPR